MPNVTAKKIEEINNIIDEVLKKYGLEIDETTVSENLIEIKIIPAVIRKPRKKIIIINWFSSIERVTETKNTGDKNEAFCST